MPAELPAPEGDRDDVQQPELCPSDPSPNEKPENQQNASEQSTPPLCIEPGCEEPAASIENGVLHCLIHCIEQSKVSEESKPSSPPASSDSSGAPDLPDWFDLDAPSVARILPDLKILYLAQRIPDFAEMAKRDYGLDIPMFGIGGEGQSISIRNVASAMFESHYFEKEGKTLEALDSYLVQCRLDEFTRETALQVYRVVQHGVSAEPDELQALADSVLKKYAIFHASGGNNASIDDGDDAGVVYPIRVCRSPLCGNPAAGLINGDPACKEHADEVRREHNVKWTPYSPARTISNTNRTRSKAAKTNTKTKTKTHNEIVAEHPDHFCKVEDKKVPRWARLPILLDHAADSWTDTLVMFGLLWGKLDLVNAANRKTYFTVSHSLSQLASRIHKRSKTIRESLDRLQTQHRIYMPIPPVRGRNVTPILIGVQKQVLFAPVLSPQRLWNMSMQRYLVATKDGDAQKARQEIPRFVRHLERMKKEGHDNPGLQAILDSIRGNDSTV